MIPVALAQGIHQLVTDMPVELVAGLVAAVEKVEDGRWKKLQAALMLEAGQPDLKQKISDFLLYWQKEHSEVKNESIALVMMTAAQAAEHYRQARQLELVWTGPDSQVIPFRRTDQALLQLINEAHKSLHIVSFAVYKVDRIAQALIAAAERGVSINIYLETPDASAGKMSFDTVQALGPAVIGCAKLYIWPKEKRRLTADGKYGSLHAKIALSDHHTLLISSANLTGYAMSLNMEMGILVRGGPAPQQVGRHLQSLVEQGVFEKI